MRRARDRYGLGVGPEITWKGDKPERKRRPKRERRVPPRPSVQRPPKPATCSAPTCPYLAASPVEGRVFCADCAAKVDERAAEHRLRKGKAS